MEQVISQAPVGVSNKDIEKLFDDNNKDVVKTLSVLWEIYEEPPKKEDEWAKRRDIFDSYDKEMAVFMEQLKNKNK